MPPIFWMAEGSRKKFRAIQDKFTNHKVHKAHKVRTKMIKWFCAPVIITTNVCCKPYDSAKSLIFLLH